MGICLGSSTMYTKAKETTVRERLSKAISKMETTTQRELFYHNLTYSDREELLKYFLPKFRIDNPRSREKKIIREKESYVSSFWDKLFGRTNKKKRILDSNIKRSIEADVSAFHRNIVKDFTLNSDRFLEISTVHGRNNYEIIFLKISFFINLYILDDKIYNAYSNNDLFLRENLIDISDSFRDKYTKMSDSTIDDVEKKKILEKWTKVMKKLNKKRSKKTSDDFLDLSDIEYSVNIISGAEE